MISSMWVGQLTDMERMSLRSFVDSGHNVTLYVYDDVGDVPDGVTVRDGQEILPRERIFTHMGGSLAGFGDEFRFELLYQKGGYWVDLDVVCLHPLRCEHGEYLLATEDHKEEGKHPNPNVIHFPRKARQIDFARRLVREMRGSDQPIGPKVLKRTIEAYRMKGGLSEPVKFNPVPWWEVDDLVSPSFDWSRVEKSYTVHFWNEIWRRKGLDKNAEYPETSIYQMLRQRYLRDDPPASGAMRPGEMLRINDRPGAKVSVLVTTYLRPACLDRCLESIRRYTPDLPILVQETNGNVSWGRNKLLRECRTPYAVIVEDDMWFTNQTDLAPLISILEHDPEIFFAGGVIEDQWDTWAHDWCPKNKVLDAQPSTRKLRYTSNGIRYQPCNLITQFGAVRTAQARQLPWDDELPLREHLAWFWSWRHKHLAALTDACQIRHDSARPSYQYSKQRLRFVGLLERAERKIGFKIQPILGNYSFPNSPG